MDNHCSFCQEDKGDNGIAWLIECIHFIGSDQCAECNTFQICFDCTKDSAKVQLWNLAESSYPSFLLKGNAP